MAPKESKKGWEKERRNRLNIAFDNLGKLLPCFDPSIKLSKIEILEKATTFINELDTKVNKPLTEVNDESEKQEGVEIKKLYERINKLLSRNELLNNLLKNAGIKAPKEYGFKKISPTKKWSQKISPNLANILAQKEAQKENKPVKRKKTRNKNRPIQKVPIPRNKRVNVKARRKKSNATIRVLNQNLLPIASVQSCYFISNQVTNNATQKSKAVLNASPNIKQTSQILTSLPSTTLLLTNNNIPTILPQPVFQNTPFIVKPTYILLSNGSNQNCSTAVSDSSKVNTITKSLAPIRPKKRNVTTTTQVNKVPIPALTSSYGNYLVLSSNEVVRGKAADKKEVKKKVKRALNDQSKGLGSLQEPALKKSKASSELTNKEVTSAKPLKEPVIITKNVSEQSVGEEKTIIQKNQSSESPSKPLVNISSTIIVPPSEIQLPNTSQKDPTINVKISSRPAAPITLKDTPNIITDKELLNTINITTAKDIETIVNQTELSSDLFATLQVPSGSQNPDSTSPTAAFLNAFPLVSSKIQEVLEDETSDSRRDTPTLLQIGTMDVTKTTQTVTDNLTPSLMNLENFAFFNSKDIIYQPFDNIVTTANEVIFTPATVTTAKVTEKVSPKVPKDAKIIYEHSNFKATATLAPPSTQRANHVALQNHNHHANISVKLNDTLKLDDTKLNKPSINVVKKNLFPVLPTTTTNSVPIITSSAINQMYYTSVTSTMQSSLTYHSNKVKVSPEKYPKYNNAMQQSAPKTNQNLECNTLNPFNDTPKTGSNCSYNISTTKSYSDIYAVNSNCHYNYQTDFSANFNSTANKQYYNKDTSQTGRYYGYDNYDTYKNDASSSAATNYYTDKNKFINQQKPANKATDVIPKAPVNWMTTPDLKQTQTNSDFLLFPSNKEGEQQQVPSYPQNSFNNNPSQNSYFNASAPIYPSISSDYNMISDPKKHFDLPFQRNEHEEHQINWSPTKHVNLDSSHNFGTLPTLEGDLALGTQGPYIEPKLTTPKKDLSYKAKDARRNVTPNYEISNNILSVSQLVEPCAKLSETPAKVSNRRSSGGRFKSNSSQGTSRNTKRSNNKTTSEVVNAAKTTKYKPVYNQNEVQNTFIPDNNMWLSSNNKGASTSGKNVSSRSNYTAESLISHHHQGDVASSKSSRSNQQYYHHKSLPTPSFLPDNIMPYFPTMDMPTQDGNNQHNQNYAGTNSFPAATFPVSIQNSYNNNYNLPTPSNYLQHPNYMPDLGNHDYGLLSDNIFSHTTNVKPRTSSKVVVKSDQQDTHAKKSQVNYQLATSSNYPQSTKKSKKKPPVAEATPPNLSNIEFGWSMPGNINSPILPDEFHAANFLPPPPNPHQLYPCKTPLYGTKQAPDLTPANLLPLPSVTRSNLQHPEISPANNIGPTLTNFHLSAIFPEINKIPPPSDNYIDSRSKHLSIPISNKTNYSHNHSLTTPSTSFTNP